MIAYECETYLRNSLSYDSLVTARLDAASRRCVDQRGSIIVIDE